LSHKGIYHRNSDKVLRIEEQLKLALKEDSYSVIDYLISLKPSLLSNIVRNRWTKPSSPIVPPSEILSYIDLNSKKKLIWYGRKMDEVFPVEEGEEEEEEDEEEEEEEDDDDEEEEEKEEEIQNPTPVYAVPSDLILFNQLTLRNFFPFPKGFNVASFLFGKKPYDPELLRFMKDTFPVGERLSSVVQNAWDWDGVLQEGLRFIKNVQELDQILSIITPNIRNCDNAPFGGGGVEVCEYLLKKGGVFSDKVFLNAALMMDRTLFDWVRSKSGVAFDLEKLQQQFEELLDFEELLQIGDKGVNVFDYFYSNGYIRVFDGSPYWPTIAAGNLPLLKHFFELRIPLINLDGYDDQEAITLLTEERMQAFVTAAIEYSQPEVLEFLLDKFQFSDFSFVFTFCLSEILSRKGSLEFDFMETMRVIEKRLPLVNGERVWPIPPSDVFSWGDIVPLKALLKSDHSTPNSEMNSLEIKRTLESISKKRLITFAIFHDQAKRPPIWELAVRGHHRTLFQWLLDLGCPNQATAFLERVLFIIAATGFEAEAIAWYKEGLTPWFKERLELRFPEITALIYYGKGK